MAISYIKEYFLQCFSFHLLIALPLQWNEKVLDISHPALLNFSHSIHHFL